MSFPNVLFLWESFSWTTDFPGLVFLFSRLESNDLRPDALPDPPLRSWQDALWLPCDRILVYARLRIRWFGTSDERSLIVLSHRCLNWLGRRTRRLDLDRSDESSIPPISTRGVIFLNPVISVGDAQTDYFSSKGPLFCDWILESDPLCRPQKWKFSPFWRVVFLTLTFPNF